MFSAEAQLVSHLEMGLWLRRPHPSLERGVSVRCEREGLFGSREREGKLKFTFPFYGKGTGIEKMPREGKFEVCYPGKQEREKIWLHSRLYLKVQ